MKKTAATKPCNCLKQVNESLADSGVELETSLAINFETGKASVEGPFLSVRWKGKPIRGSRLPTLVCNFCPVCGRKKAS